jgi:hypothetical protein
VAEERHFARAAEQLPVELKENLGMAGVASTLGLSGILYA